MDTNARQPVMKAARHASVLLASAAMLALAACSDNDAPGSVIVGSAEAQTPEAAAEGERRTNPSAVTAPRAQGSVDVAALMEEGPLPDIVIGDPDAPVTIVEYASLTCSHCANFHVNSLPAVKADYVDTGIAKIVVREFPFDPRALAGFMLARCVPENQRESMIDVLFQQQANWARAENASAALLSIARLSGMSQDEFAACLQNTELQGQITSVKDRGENEFGVNATPTFFINGDRYAGALSADEMAAVIESHR
ncbi:DsbA family protein [Aureimonas populi]|uniref:DsbA family protein n=1 Tax=Aureimonas populi TaxID=1701758 RepID=A0ABW5CQJ6_9HYPH|nr:DsbA family protein [Aureimonas populi]